MRADLYSSNPPLPPIRSHVYFIHCLSPNPGKVSSPSSLPQSPLLLPSPLCPAFHIALSPRRPCPLLCPTATASGPLRRGARGGAAAPGRHPRGRMCAQCQLPSARPLPGLPGQVGLRKGAAKGPRVSGAERGLHSACSNLNSVLGADFGPWGERGRESSLTGRGVVPS